MFYSIDLNKKSVIKTNFIEKYISQLGDTKNQYRIPGTKLYQTFKILQI